MVLMGLKVPPVLPVQMVLMELKVLQATYLKPQMLLAKLFLITCSQT